MVGSSNESDSSPQQSYHILLCTDAAAHVTSISQRITDSVVQLRMSGSGFPFSTMAVQVAIGDIGCNVTSSENTTLICNLDVVGNKMAFGCYDIKVKVHATGFAVVQRDVKFCLKPHVTGLTPSAGSLAGGLSITVAGLFAIDATDNTIEFKNGNLTVGTCAVITAGYFSIICQTPPTGEDIVAQLDVYFPNGTLIPCVTSECYFNFTDSLTPHVSGVAPDQFTGSATLYIHGNHFGVVASNVAVHIDVHGMQYLCDVTEVNETYITCLVTNLPTGKYRLSVKIADKGNAVEMVNISTSLTITDNYPSSGSICGGTRVTVLGAGFLNIPRVGYSMFPLLQYKPSADPTGNDTVMAFKTSRSCSWPGCDELSVRSNISFIYHDSLDKIIEHDAAVTFNFTESHTPRVMATTGNCADMNLTVYGDFLNQTNTDSNVVSLKKDGDPYDYICSPITQMTDTLLTCVLPELPGGTYNLRVYVDPLGDACTNVTWECVTSLKSFSPTTGECLNLLQVLQVSNLLS